MGAYPNFMAPYDMYSEHITPAHVPAIAWGRDAFCTARGNARGSPLMVAKRWSIELLLPLAVSVTVMGSRRVAAALGR